MQEAIYIHIERGRHLISLCAAGRLLHRWPCAVGKRATPTPAGQFRIVNKAVLDGRQVYGSRWMGLDRPRYGIHGTNNPASIGREVSLGCVRMHNKDAEKLFGLVAVGTVVNIT
jgi:lipoprotein-anchoring transpeptidase ErfK/SrfK